MSLIKKQIKGANQLFFNTKEVQIYPFIDNRRDKSDVYENTICGLRVNKYHSSPVILYTELLGFKTHFRMSAK